MAKKRFAIPLSLPDEFKIFWAIRFLQKSDVMFLFVWPLENRLLFDRLIETAYIEQQAFNVKTIGIV